MSDLGLHELKINERFSKALPALREDERKALEANLKAEGWRSYERILLWEEGDCILDGHNRYEICHEHGIEFLFELISFPTADAAHIWLIDNQLGRRSMTKEQYDYQIGQRYNLEKKSHGGHKPKPQKEKEVPEKGTSSNRTQEKIAEQFKVSKNTVERNAKYATAVDKIEKAAGSEAKQRILNGDLKLPKQDVVKLAEQSPEKQRKLVEKPVAEIRKALNPEVVTAADTKSPYTASDRWDSVMKGFTGFQVFSYETWEGEEGRPDYPEMLRSKKWDASRIFSQVQLLEAHIADVTDLRDAMIAALSESQVELLNNR